jgi:hypothetical protein
VGGRAADGAERGGAERARHQGTAIEFVILVFHRLSPQWLATADRPQDLGK